MIEKNVGLIGVPMDLGGGRRGVDMGPSALRIAGIEAAIRGMGLGFEDLGNVHVEQPESHAPERSDARFLLPPRRPARATHGSPQPCERSRPGGSGGRRPRRPASRGGQLG